MTHRQCRVWRPGAWIVALALGVGVAMTADASSAARLQGPTWLAEDIKGGGVIDNAQSTVSIAVGGKMTGSGGCNRMFGTATVAGDALTFGGIGTTRKACAPALMDQERASTALPSNCSANVSRSQSGFVNLRPRQFRHPLTGPALFPSAELEQLCKALEAIEAETSDQPQIADTVDKELIRPREVVRRGAEKLGGIRQRIVVL